MTTTIEIIKEEMMNDVFFNSLLSGEKQPHLDFQSRYFNRQLCNILIATEKSIKYAKEVAAERFIYPNLKPIFENKHGQIIYAVSESKAYGEYISEQDQFSSFSSLIEAAKILNFKLK